MLDVQDDSDEPEDPPTIVLNVTYPEAYPDVGPHLDLTSPPNASKYPLLDVFQDKAQLLESLQSTIEESLGMAMVFTLVTTLKESAEALIADRQRQEQAVRDVEARQAEEAENRKFHGTAVTRESFLEWRAKFRNEMEDKERRQKEEEEADDKKKRGKVEEKKMTGRELWEKGLVGKVDDEEAEADEAAIGVEKLKVDG